MAREWSSSTWFREGAAEHWEDAPLGCQEQRSDDAAITGATHLTAW